MDKIESRIKELLDGKYFHDENGMFYEEIFPERGDELPKETVKKICSSKNPEEALDEWMFDVYQFYEKELYDNVFDIVWQDEIIQSHIKRLKIKEAEFEIRSLIDDVFYVKYPYDYFLNQSICVNVIVDTGDGNYEFTLNQPFASWDGKDATHIDENSSLLWLAKQQGYTKGQLTKTLRDGETGDSKFLKSVLQEVQNVSSWMNCLAFFVQMPLKEWIDLDKHIKQEKPLNDEYHPRKSKGRGYLILRVNTPCGLYDAWNGAGGTLEVALEKPVKLPFRFIDSIYPDGCRGYEISEIYGLPHSFWEEGAIKEVHPMKKLEMES